MHEPCSLSVLLFWIGLFLIAYIYSGYGVLLGLLARRHKTAPPAILNKASTSVTVLLCVHNEEANVKKRLDNLMAQDYPPCLMDVLVVSDGSTDATENIVKSYSGKFPVRLLVSPRLGKSGAQNLAVPKAKGDVIVLTDAEAVFDPGFVHEIAAPFIDPSVGCATANLGLMDREGVIAKSQGLYWRYEQTLRRLESDLGLLAVASGQSMAFRRSLFVDLPPYVGDDCFIPLAIVEQGKRTVYCDKARAYDAFESEVEREFATRVRMTMRNWTGTWLFPSLLNPLRRPGYALALWSHKLLRWLGGAILALIAITAMVMLVSANGLNTFFGFACLAFLAYGALGYLAERRHFRLPLAGTVYSFLLVNVAFTLGVWRGLTGKKVFAYKAGSLKT